MTDVLRSVKEKFEKLQQEREQIANSVAFFRQNFESAQVRLIQIEGQLNILNQILTEKDIPTPEPKEE